MCPSSTGCCPPPRRVTPANWKPGEDVMIALTVSDDEARATFGEWKSVKPYIRIVPEPR